MACSPGRTAGGSKTAVGGTSVSRSTLGCDSISVYRGSWGGLVVTAGGVEVWASALAPEIIKADVHKTMANTRRTPNASQLSLPRYFFVLTGTTCRRRRGWFNI